MRRSLALLLPAVLLSAACAQSPTDATRRPVARFDGGNTLGSGNAVNPGGESSSGTSSTATTSTTATSDSVQISEEGRGIFFGGGY